MNGPFDSIVDWPSSLSSRSRGPVSYRFIISPAKNATMSSKATWSSALGAEHTHAVAQEVQKY